MREKALEDLGMSKNPFGEEAEAFVDEEEKLKLNMRKHLKMS